MIRTEEQVICLLLLENLDRVGMERELKPRKNGLKHYKSLYFSVALALFAFNFNIAYIQVHSQENEPVCTRC